jgi:hypothetical protein
VAPIVNRVCLHEVMAQAVISRDACTTLVGPKLVTISAGPRQPSAQLQMHVYGSQSFFEKYGDSPIDVARSDVNVRDRLLYAVKWLRERKPGRQLRTRIFPLLTVYWETDPSAPLPRGVPAPHENSGPADMIVIFDEEERELREDPNIEFAGLATQIAFQEIEVKLDFYWDGFVQRVVGMVAQRQREVLDAIRGREHLADPDLVRFAYMDEATVMSQVEEIFRLRAALDGKLEFFDYNRRRRPDLAANTRHTLLQEFGDQPDSWARSILARDAFKRLCCDSYPYLLNRTLVDLIWPVRPSRGAELGLQFPWAIENIQSLGDRHLVDDPFTLADPHSP